MIAYTITAALQCGIFKDVFVSTEDEQYAEIARHYGASVPFMRPAEFALDSSPDIDWVDFTLRKLNGEGAKYEAFFLLRPTSPFRTGAMLNRAWAEFCSATNVDSLRAVQKCSEHPGKMWVIRHGRMFPLMPFECDGRPWHSSPYQSLPEVFIQNASLEIAWSDVVFNTRTIAGCVHLPFVTDGYEGFDINDESDWDAAQQLIADGRINLVAINRPPFF